MNETDNPATIEVKKLAALALFIGGCVVMTLGFQGAIGGSDSSFATKVGEPATISQLANGEAVPVRSIRNALEAEGLGAHVRWHDDQTVAAVATSLCYVSAHDSWGPYDAIDFATDVYNSDVATGYWSMEVYGDVSSYSNAAYTIMDVTCPDELDALMAR